MSRTRRRASAADRTPRRRPAGRRWKRRLAIAGLLAAATTLFAGALLHRTLSRQLDAQLAGGWSALPIRIATAPIDLRIGRALTPGQLAGWLDRLGYVERDRARGTGEFSVGAAGVTMIRIDGPARGRTYEVRFAGDGAAGRVAEIRELPPGRRVAGLTLGAPLLSTLDPAARRRRRVVPFGAVPTPVVQAVLAAEDHRFFRHRGVDPIRVAAALVTNLSGDRPYLVGASTLTQQLVKNTLLSPAQTVSRKLREQALAVLLERRLSKQEILELYLNDVYLGQQETYAIHGVGQGARALFGKHLRNLTLGEAATLAGIIRAPQAHRPRRDVARARDRRNSVLQAMVERGYVGAEAAMRAAREPLATAAADATGDIEAPYFVDLVSTELGPAPRPGSPVETTLDVRLQALAEAAVEAGLRRIETRPERTGSPPQAALIAVDPDTGAIRALVGGRSYLASQFNRATRAHRQPGSIVKPFVYLAAVERARQDPDYAFDADTLIDDTPTTFYVDGRPWRPANHGGIYDGPVPARLALARSRNVAAVKVGAQAGFDAVAALWAAAAGGPAPPAYPALALGAFEATPLAVAAAYAVLANGGRRVPLHGVARRDAAVTKGPRVAAPESVAVVRSMLEDTFTLGTAVSARRAGFRYRAAGKTGTTDGLRDAWFAGFTDDLLAVVWVGADDGSPLGLTGAEAALPIWTAFMQRATDVPQP